MTRLELDIEGMHCGHCVAAVSNALRGLPGVTTAEVKIGTAVVTYDPTRVSPDDMMLVVADEGYSASVRGPAVA